MTGPLLNSTQAAEYCGFRGGAQRLRNMKAKGQGPEWVKVGHRLMYRAHDLDAWLNQQIKKPVAATTGQNTGK